MRGGSAAVCLGTDHEVYFFVIRFFQCYPGSRGSQVFRVNKVSIAHKQNSNEYS